jgi:hypothetical protein
MRWATSPGFLSIYFYFLIRIFFLCCCETFYNPHMCCRPFLAIKISIMNKLVQCMEKIWGYRRDEYLQTLTGMSLVAAKWSLAAWPTVIGFQQLTHETGLPLPRGMLPRMLEPSLPIAEGSTEKFRSEESPASQGHNT